MTAEDVIALLALMPHPEGGHYRETWRHRRDDGGRAAGTSIYFLLAAGQVSRWHRVDAAEIWHWYGGAPLSLRTWRAGGKVRSLALGNGLARGERPQAIVEPHEWQTARSLGDWTLAGCTVSPGFEFEGFEMAEEGWEPS